jgi:predicted metal-dependent peptidase
MDKEPLIYLFIINTDFVPEEKLLERLGGFACVTFKNKRVNFIYDPMIFEKFDVREIYFIVLHEAFHIFKKHLEIYKDFKCNPILLNISMDAVINNEISGMNVSYNLKPEIIKGTAIIPEEYKRENNVLGKDAYTTKRLYYWYLEKAKQKMEELKKQFLKPGSYVHINGTDKYGRIESSEKGNYVIDIMTKEEMFDDLKQKKNHGKKEEHKAKDLTPVVFGDSSYHGEEAEDQTIMNPHENSEEAEENKIETEIFTKKLVQKAKEMEKHLPQTAGNEIGGFTKIVEKLLEPKVNWKSVLFRHLNLFFSRNASKKENKKSFITYPWNPKSRYGILCKHHIETICKQQSYIILAIDTSGSIFGSQDELEVFFTEIEAMAKWLSFSKSGSVLTIQWDTQIAEPLTEYKHMDWKKFNTGKRKVKGGGGTTPQIVFQYLDKIFVKRDEHFLIKEKDINFLVPDKTKLPFLIFLTDGYFYGKLKKSELGVYKDCTNNILFFTKSKESLFKDANAIIYE